MSTADKLRKHKDEAARQLAKGRLKEALDELMAVQKLDPRDLANRQKVGDLHRKLNNNDKAIEAYQAVAGAYAADGLLLKAIAVCKLILQIDANHTETQRTLADLYGKKRGDFNQAEMPAAMSAAVASAKPGQKLSASMIRGIPATQLPLKQRPDGSNGEAAGRVPTGTVAPSRAIELPPEPEPTAPPPPVAPQAAAPGEIELDLSTDSASIEVEVVDEAAEQPPVAMGSPLAAAPPPPAAAAGWPPRPSVPAQPLVDDVPVVQGVPEILETAVVGVPLAASTSVAPAAAWGGAPVAGPPPLEDMEMPAELVGGAEIEVETGGADTEFADFMLDEAPAAPHKVDLDKLPPIPLFSDLSKNAFIDLLNRMDIRLMSAGDVIIQEGQRGDSFFIIASGNVRIEKVIDGKPKELAQLSDGAFFGEMALLSEAPRSASVIATDDGELFEISRETLDAVIDEFPSVKQVMLKFYKQRLLVTLMNVSPIFAPFDKTQRKGLIEMFRSREVEPGEMILSEGQKGDGLYMVLSGRCSVLKTGDKGPLQLATLKEGDVFGEMSLLTRAPVSASIQATSRAIVLRLPRKQFNEVIMTHPQVLEMVSELSASRQRNNERLVSTGGQLV